MALFDPKVKAISNLQKSIDEKKLLITKNFDKIGRLYYGQYKDMNVDVTTDINTCCAVSPMLSVSIMPVIAEPNVPCRETQREYRLTGTMVNRFTAINPLI